MRTHEVLNGPVLRGDACCSTHGPKSCTTWATVKKDLTDVTSVSLIVKQHPPSFMQYLFESSPSENEDSPPRAHSAHSDVAS